MFYRTSVIIVNWNNQEDTIKCIESLHKSVNPCHIVVVDNGSTSDNVKQLEQIQGITLIKSLKNLGFGRGNNIGIRWALINTDCEFILLLNNDATVKEDTISKLEEALDAHPEVGVTTPRIVLSANPEILWYGGGCFYWPKGAPRTPGYHGSTKEPLADIERNVTFASGCAMLVRRSVLENVGGFDPRYFMYEEDAELCLRILESGWMIRYISKALVFHDCQGSQRKKNSTLWPFLHPRNPSLFSNVYHITRNRLITAKTHAKGWNFVRFWTIFPFYLLSKCIKFAICGRWDAVRSVFIGIRDFIREINQPFVNELEKK